jgi:hypothetical protein
MSSATPCPINQSIEIKYKPEPAITVMSSCDDQYQDKNEVDKRLGHYSCVPWQNNDQKSEST